MTEERNVVSNDIVFNYVKNNNDLFKNILILRLYDEYKKNVKLENNEDYDFVNVLNINVAYNNIKNVLDDKNLKIDYYLYNDKIKGSIQMYSNMLASYINNFDKKNSKKTEDIVELITILECLLKLPISFPSSVSVCIEKFINEKKIENKGKLKI